MKWMPTANQGFQTSHFFIGVAILFAANSFGAPLWLAALLPLAWALPKEFAFDLLVEGDSLGGSAEDFAWYYLGDVAALCLVGVASLCRGVSPWA